MIVMELYELERVRKYKYVSQAKNHGIEGQMTRLGRV